MVSWTLVVLALVLKHHEGYRTGVGSRSTSISNKNYEICLLSSALTSVAFSNPENSEIYSHSPQPSKVNSQKSNTTSVSGALSSLQPDSDNNADRTRGALVRIIEESWSRVSQLIPESTLTLCQEELKGATSLLVLATVRRAADDSAVSRATVEGMFREADVNNDGQLTFQEWFQWLGAAPSTSSTYHSQNVQLRISTASVKESSTSDTTGASIGVDPMVEALSLVLSNAVCTLKTTARITQDPSVLAAAFVAGGTLAGVLDASVCDTMLSRLSPKTREMVTRSLMLESDSLPSSFRAVLSPLTSPKPTNKVSSAVKPLENMRSRVQGGVKRTGTAGNASARAPVEDIEGEGGGDQDEGDDDAMAGQEARELREKRSKLRAERSAVLTAAEAQAGRVDAEAQAGRVDAEAQAGRVDAKGTVPGVGAGMGNSNIGGTMGAGVGVGKGGRLIKPMGGKLLSMSSELLSSLKGARGRDSIPGVHARGSSSKTRGGVVRDMDQDVIQTVDLPSVPVLVAPPIEDRADSATTVTFIPAADVYSFPTAPSPPSSMTKKHQKSYSAEEFSYSEFEFEDIPGVSGANIDTAESRVSSGLNGGIDGLGLVLEGSIEEVEYSDIRYTSKGKKSPKIIEKENSTKRETAEGLKYFLPPDESSINNVDADMGGLRFTPSPGSDSGSSSRSARRSVPMSVSMMSAAEEMGNELTALKNDLGDLDDAHAQIMRQLLLSKGEGRTDVLGLAMALRSTRLQHSAQFPLSVKQQLAVETLQLWAPLSYQVGMSAQIPELEIHSYVLLFPTSFGTFVNWYGQFRSVAKALLRSFRSAVTKRLRRDSVMPVLSDGVTIQSRLKTPPSAFKKMFKSAKKRQQLHDMIGMRIIISEKNNLPADPDTDTDTHTDAHTRISAPHTRSDACKADEEAAVWRVYSIVCSSLSQGSKGSSEWVEDKERFKDYVTAPKPSGYQSLHMTLLHKESGIKMEVQIRSQRMHWEAEYGAAAHTKYKALILPSGNPEEREEGKKKK